MIDIVLKRNGFGFNVKQIFYCFLVIFYIFFRGEKIFKDDSIWLKVDFGFLVRG